MCKPKQGSIHRSKFLVGLQGNYNLSKMKLADIYQSQPFFQLNEGQLHHYSCLKEAFLDGWKTAMVLQWVDEGYFDEAEKKEIKKMYFDVEMAG
jgi:hypothetical protein